MSEERIEELVLELGEKFQELEKLVEKEGIEKVNIKFPWGVIRTAWYFRNEKLSFIDNETLKRNLAYHLMLTDVYEWILNRFDIGLTAQEMLIKEGICLYGNIIAAVTKYIARDIGDIGDGERLGVRRATTILKENGIISKDLRDEILEIWGVRNREHIEDLKDWEYQKYSLDDYDKAVYIWERLVESLIEAQQNGKI